MAVQTNIPVPDPSLLTVELLRREISQLRDLIDLQFVAVEGNLKLVQIAIDRIPIETDRRVSSLKDVLLEKFFTIESRFAERDMRMTLMDVTAKTAVDAALLAQRETAAAQNAANSASISKSELVTAKQIDGLFALLTANSKSADEKNAALQLLLTAMSKSFDDKIEDVVGRLNRAEGSNKGSSAMILMIVTVISVVVAAGSFVINVMGHH